MKKKELRASARYWRATALHFETMIGDMQRALQKGLGSLAPAVEHAEKARDVLLAQSAELVRLRQGERAACEDTIAPLRALLGGAVSRLAPKAVSGQTVLLINDLRAEVTTLRQQSATDRKLAGEAADESARLQGELAEARVEAAKVRRTADAGLKRAVAAEQDVETLLGELDQERRRRERAEMSLAALDVGWRDATMDPPPERQMVLARSGEAWALCYVEDGWRTMHDGELIETPRHWLPLSALPPLPARGA